MNYYILTVPNHHPILIQLSSTTINQLMNHRSAEPRAFCQGAQAVAPTSAKQRAPPPPRRGSGGPASRHGVSRCEQCSWLRVVLWLTSRINSKNKSQQAEPRNNPSFLDYFCWLRLVFSVHWPQSSYYTKEVQPINFRWQCRPWKLHTSSSVWPFKLSVCSWPTAIASPSAWETFQLLVRAGVCQLAIKLWGKAGEGWGRPGLFLGISSSCAGFFWVVPVFPVQ